jgi:hypothetical protein
MKHFQAHDNILALSLPSMTEFFLPIASRWAKKEKSSVTAPAAP